MRVIHVYWVYTGPFSTGVCYIYSDVKMSWPDAVNDCELRGGHMVAPTSRNSLDMINVLNWRTFWVRWTDAEEEGTWVDGDGNYLATSDVIWTPGEPSDSGDFGQMWAGGLDDTISGKLNHYICETVGSGEFCQLCIWSEAILSPAVDC